MGTKGVVTSAGLEVTVAGLKGTTTVSFPPTCRGGVEEKDECQRTLSLYYHNVCNNEQELICGTAILLLRD